jgi:diguanylate cyclase
VIQYAGKEVSMPELDDKFKTTTEIAKKVLPKMAEWEVPLIPENYHVWYEYFIGSNERLRANMDEIMRSGKSFSPEINGTLYDRYFGKEKNDALMQQVHRETQKILKNIFNEILIASTFTSDYENKLQGYSRNLDDAGELSEIQHIIENMIKDTKEMAESSRSLQERLEEASSHSETLKKQLEKTQREATIDVLTGLHNRKALERKIKDLHNEFKENGTLFSVIMFDVDFFKSFNDKYGHKIGDEALEIVGSTLREYLKGSDFPARYGGEEFVVLLSTTARDNACTVAEQIRKRISEKKLRLVKTGESLCNITVSLGVSEVNSEDTIDSLMERADKALYLAKDSGRNNVKSEKDLAQSSRR